MIVNEPRLIVEVPSGGALERALGSSPLASIADGEVLVESGPTDAQGNLEAQDAGQVVLSVASPEALRREADEVRRVIAHAGEGAQPLVIEVEAAEDLREDELGAVIEAARHTPRAVILRVVHDA
jgi:hypothetical protein